MSRGGQRGSYGATRARGGYGARGGGRGAGRGQPSRGGLSKSFRNKRCRNCSYWAGESTYHNKPYTGPHAKCLYTRDGKRREGFEAIKATEEKSEFDEKAEAGYEDYGVDENGVDVAEEYDDYYGEDYYDGVYGVSEGAYLPQFMNDQGGPAIGAHD